MKIKIVPILTFMVTLALPATGQLVDNLLGLTIEPLQVGEVVGDRYATPHPYTGAGGPAPALVWAREIHHPGATYVCPHFSRFDLAEGDYLIVRSPNTQRSWRYEARGKINPENQPSGFWGIHIRGESLVLELYSSNAAGGYGFEIDQVAVGKVNLDFTPETICGDDDSDWAQCYTGTSLYTESMAVARLLIQGSGLCTGWLVGSEGHLLTNNHCISTQEAAANTNFEFGAEGTCGQTCGQLQCDGTIVTTSSTLVQTSSALDYTLLLLDVNPTATYGYMQMSDTPTLVDERIYIPQHPNGWGKRIAVVSTDAHDATGFAEIDSVFDNGGRTMATYYADTQGGSSGSPVLSYDDDCVVVLHSGAFGCTGSGNTGTVAEQIVGDLSANMPTNGICVSGLLFENGFESGDSTVWSATVP